MEQDFLIWLKKHKELLTNDPQNADWHYLPVYWTRWYLNHNFAIDGEGSALLKTEVDKVLIDSNKTFTIAMVDGGALVDIGNSVVFTSARTINDGIDIPLLCSPHKKPFLPIKKKYIATFNGSFDTHPIRTEMVEKLRTNADVLIDTWLPTRFYKRWLWGKSFNLNIMASYIALCPRGSSCSSFRFFEAMQLGVAPCLIGDRDVRPFKNFIPWDEMSYYASSIEELEDLLKNLDKNEAIEKGKKSL